MYLSRYYNPVTINVIIITSDEKKLSLYSDKLFEISNLYNNFKCKIYPVNKFNRMHNKFCIIDEKLIITGSYNWTINSRNNKENIIISLDHTIVQEYKKEFLKLSNNSLELKDFLFSKKNLISKYCNICNNKNYRILVISLYESVDGRVLSADEICIAEASGASFSYIYYGTLLEYCIYCNNFIEILNIPINNSIFSETSLFLESSLIKKYNLHCVFEKYLDGIESLEWKYNLIWVDDHLSDKLKNIFCRN